MKTKFRTSKEKMTTEIESTEKREDMPESNTEDDLPQKILEKYPCDIQVQLIKGYRILQVLMYYKNNAPFFEKPLNEEHCGKFYYDVIKNPMWFYEIKRKIFDAEYNSLAEVIKDMRLTFENCYYFWGPKTTLSEQCVKMERLMEKHLLSLPKDLKMSCSLEETHGKSEDENFTKIWNRYRSKGKNCSNLMLRTWRRKRILEGKQFEEKSDLDNFCDHKNEILNWEKDVLRLEDHQDSILIAIQLPQIGQFLHLVRNIFEVECCQIEVERMFLMPQFSLCFQKILNLLLTDDESSEDVNNYEDLMMKFKTTVIHWYSVYEEKQCDDVAASREIGIEPEFFRIFGKDNPLLCKNYEDLSYHQKVIMMKSLCDFSVRRKANIKELVTKANKTDFAAEVIGRDKFGYGYLFFNTFFDFRLYKQQLMEDDVALNKEPVQGIEDDSTLRKFFSKGSSFKMIADSVEALRQLIDELIYSDVETVKRDVKSTNHEIIECLRKLESRVVGKEDKYVERTNYARIKMFDEWKNASSKDYSQYVDSNFKDEKFSSEVGNSNTDDSVPTEMNLDTNMNNPQATENDENIVTKSETEDSLSQIEINHTEIKDEPQTDDSSSESNVPCTRRRRSSVPNYNVFDKKLFSSDESDSESPEEIYTDDDYSDDDWDVPKKKRKKSKNKFSKPPKLNAEDYTKRRRKSVEKYASTIISDARENVRSSLNIDCVIKEEHSIDTDSEEILEKETDKDKLAMKIKVVDLAKLQKTKNDQNERVQAVKTVPQFRIVNPVNVQVPRGTVVNSPSMQNFAVMPRGNLNVFSNVHPAFAIVGQPPVISNAYIITTDQRQFQTVNANHYQIQQLNSSYGTHESVKGRRAANVTQTVNTNFVGNRCNVNSPNNAAGLVSQNTSTQFPSSIPSKQVPRPSFNISNPQSFSPNQIRNPNAPAVISSRKTFVTPNSSIRAGRSTTIPKFTKASERNNLFKEIEGTIGIHSNNGILQYVVNLANGTHVPLSNEQVQKLRDGNNGALPLKLKIPVPCDVAEKIEPCVIIDD